MWSIWQIEAMIAEGGDVDATPWDDSDDVLVERIVAGRRVAAYAIPRRPERRPARERSASPFDTAVA